MPTQKIMQAVEIRRAGNGNAISLPSDFEDLGYVAGATVVVAATPSCDPSFNDLCAHTTRRGQTSSW